jgi:2-polyprenyl-3-methyl-5-hydroxy-6-metoxy-1,4-benzoquinol methylase
MSLVDPIKKIARASIDFQVYARNQFSVFLRKLVKEQHQLTSVTADNRYPELFSEVRSFLGAKENLSILSFGCSTGQECFSLQTYFPNSKITGVDINKNNLRKANRKNRHENIKFLFSTPETIIKQGKYDIIFCLSVLCRWEDTKDLDNCAHVYAFDKFSQTVSMLADQIKTGGLMVVYNSNFRFEESESFKDFVIVPTPSVHDSGFVHKFDSNHNRIRKTHVHCVYQKR